MLDIGVEPFLLASTLTLVVGQRLVRRLCTHCRETIGPNPSVMESLKSRSDFAATIQALQTQNFLSKGDDPLAGMRLFKAKGCAQCHGSGFRGRIGIFELFEINDQTRNLILERRDVASIRAAAIAGGMKTLFQDGLGKAFLGHTTLEEVTRVAL
jgi:type II secretory ATPase GspE/PulE/Tfp pilus assembly ATPase PilB-like protein